VLLPRGLFALKHATTCAAQGKYSRIFPAFFKTRRNAPLHPAKRSKKRGKLPSQRCELAI